jgi:putative ABC transport system permease protein
MDPRENLRISWRAIRSHTLRSTLTTLGIVIGVGAVITFVTLGASLQAAVIGEVGGEAAADVYLWAGPDAANGQGGPGFGAEPVFTDRDLGRMAALPAVAEVIPYGGVATSAVTYRGDTVSKSQGVVATSPAYLAGQEFREGRSFEPGAAEVVLTPAAAEGFVETVTVGGTLAVTRANGDSLNATVVGILNSSASIGAFEGFGTGSRVYVPVDPFYATRIDVDGEARTVFARVVVEAAGVERVEEAEDAVLAYLEGDSDAAALVGANFGFRLQTSEELLGQIRELLDILTGFVTGVAVISLVVAAIGIANIMLVSVTERTREIGIMKAVGAQNRDVLGLFLTEAVILGVIGSALGIAAGVGVAALAGGFIGFGVVFPVEWFGIAVLVGILVGVFAGLYPAWRAGRTDPIDALRYE